MESLPTELLAYILRFVPTARGEAYRSGGGWVACELAGYEDPPPTALPVTATWRDDEGAQLTAGVGGVGGGGGGGGGMAAEGHAGLRELAALTCTSRALHAALSPDIVWAPFLSRLEGRFAAFDPDFEDLWIPEHDGPPVEYYDPDRPQTRAARFAQRLVPVPRCSFIPGNSYGKFCNEGADGRLVLKRYADTARGPEDIEVPPPYRCPQDCCCAAAGPFECPTVEEFRQHCASPAHRAGVYAHLRSEAQKKILPGLILDVDAPCVDPRLFDPVGYAALPGRRRVGKLHAHVARVGRILRAPLEAVELGRDLGFGFFLNERSRMDEDDTELARGWEEALGDFAYIVNQQVPGFPGMLFRNMQCTLAAVAWVAVHSHVLPDFRRRGLASRDGYANDVILLGWRDFEVNPFDRLPFMTRVLNCEDDRLNSDDVVEPDDEADLDMWSVESGSESGNQ